MRERREIGLSMGFSHRDWPFPKPRVGGSNPSRRAPENAANCEKNAGHDAESGRSLTAKRSIVLIPTPYSR